MRVIKYLQAKGISVADFLKRQQDEGNLMEGLGDTTNPLGQQPHISSSGNQLSRYEDNENINASVVYYISILLAFYIFYL